MQFYVLVKIHFKIYTNQHMWESSFNGLESVIGLMFGKLKIILTSTSSLIYQKGIIASHFFYACYCELVRARVRVCVRVLND